MRAVEIDPSIAGGGLRVVHAADPIAGTDEVVIDVAAAGVNRADTVQRRGRYAPPAGASRFPGLECSGTISQVGPAVGPWQVGDRVCALVAGGAYAERVVAPAGQVFRAPRGLPLTEAAALPEALATVWSNLTTLARLRAGESILIHGGTSGIGTTAIQLGRLLGARVFATAGDDRKVEACRQLGAIDAVNYRRESFVERIKEWTAGRGVDVVLDLVGADYLGPNLDALAMDGRLVVIGLQSGDVAPIDLRQVLRRRAVVTGSLLRSRSIEEKTAIIAELVDRVLPAVDTGELRPVVDRIYPLDEAMRAHERVEASRHIGKILLAVPEAAAADSTGIEP